MAFEKILTHPDKNKILKMLKDGHGVRKVEAFLRDKYPGNKKLIITAPSLQRFRKEHLNIEGKALEVIKDSMAQKHLKHNLTNNNTYRELIRERVEEILDIGKTLKEIKAVVEARVEKLFDAAESVGITTNQEQNLIKYLQTILTTVDKQAKYVERIADNTGETNINITVIEDQVAIIREAVREVMMEMMAPEQATMFLEKLNQKMAEKKYRYVKPDSVEHIRADVKALNASFEVEDE